MYSLIPRPSFSSLAIRKRLFPYCKLFSVLQATKSWTGPGNEARTCILYTVLQCSHIDAQTTFTSATHTYSHTRTNTHNHTTHIHTTHIQHHTHAPYTPRPQICGGGAAGAEGDRGQDAEPICGPAALFHIQCAGPLR